MKYYNYFHTLEEFSGYFQKTFSGEGLQVKPKTVPPFLGKEACTLFLQKTKSGFEFELLSTPIHVFRFAITDMEKMETMEDYAKYRNDNLEIQFQALSRDAIHVHIAEKEQILFSGKLSSAVSGKAQMQKLLLFFQKLFSKKTTANQP